MTPVLNFRLKNNVSGITVSYKKQYTEDGTIIAIYHIANAYITQSQLTDFLALALLYDNPSAIDRFEHYPENWQQLISNLQFRYGVPVLCCPDLALEDTPEITLPKVEIEAENPAKAGSSPLQHTIFRLKFGKKPKAKKRIRKKYIKLNCKIIFLLKNSLFFILKKHKGNKINFKPKIPLCGWFTFIRSPAVHTVWYYGTIRGAPL